MITALRHYNQTLKKLNKEIKILQEIEIADNPKVAMLFQSYLGNSNNKPNLVKYLFQKWRETLSYVLTSSQTIYSANLDGITDRVTSQSSEKIDFYSNHEEVDTKMFAYIKLFCDNICLNRVIILLPDTGIVIISIYQSVLTFLRCNMVQNWYW